MKLFKRTSAKDKLIKKYQKLLEQSHQLSHSNRKESDQKQAEAEEVLEEIKRLES